MKNLTFIFLLIIFASVFTYRITDAYLGASVDNPVVYAQDNYPLGKEQSYIIELNQPDYDEEGEKILEEDMFYTFKKAGEDRQYPYLSGRHIGTTKVNLNKYLGKEVHISGHFSMGSPIIQKEENIPEFLVRDEKVVLNIESLELVR